MKIVEKTLDDYNKEHKYCPNCGNNKLMVTFAGYIFYNYETYVDKNSVSCECGWNGIVHDLVSGVKQ
jgi:ssDNA-binding Zn-finger/Zn-ribbon topoisomerase 1